MFKKIKTFFKKLYSNKIFLIFKLLLYIYAIIIIIPYLKYWVLKISGIEFIEIDNKILFYLWKLYFSILYLVFLFIIAFYIFLLFWIILRFIYLFKKLIKTFKINNKNMKIAFFGTGEFSRNILKWVLEDSRVEVKLVVSQPDKPVGRKKILEKTPIKILAEENEIEVLQPEKLLKNSDFLDYLDSLELDFILVVAYGKIVPKRVLNSAKFGCINLHWSKLPDYRGASPIQEAVKNWDKSTALTVMFMSKWMDEWDILKIEEVDIDKDDKTQDIFDKFESFWAKLAIDTLEEVINWKIKAIPQDSEKATYCSKISKEDWEIDFAKNTSEEIYNKYRAYHNWPWIYTEFKNIKLNVEECEIFEEDVERLVSFETGLSEGKVIKINKKTIWIVCFDKKILILRQVKLAGKKSMDIISFVNGNKDFLDYNF